MAQQPPAANAAKPPAAPASAKPEAPAEKPKHHPEPRPVKKFKVLKARKINLRGGHQASFEEGQILDARHYGLTKIEEFKKAGLQLDELPDAKVEDKAEE